ncbi:Fanconi anemia group D2 protein-like [Uloborus diversus]|uniref:Fanconi anemia group D2 protein-like n=1 Tax=Uloborus diversus TaxID=327109 RepID=UPI0024095764|nr:Fanconi anemia group D2 protein-like [Uloborus diversus]
MTQRTSRKKISNVSVSNEQTSFLNCNSENPEFVFRNLLEKAGFILGKENEPNEINVDQAIFLRELSKKLTAESSTLKQKFITGFEKHLDDELRLKWCLLPTVTSPSCESARSSCQDSLAHMLLGIEVIQEKISNFMLEKLVEFSYSENNALYDRSEGKSVGCLIVSQFRWLIKLVNSEAFTDKLIEVIEATPVEIQRDIIILLPEVLIEFDHPKIARHLSKYLNRNHELYLTILDTLTNLNIGVELLSEIRKDVLKIISFAKIENLPVIVKFVLQDLNSNEEARETVQELHKNLDFNSTFNPITSSTPKDAKNVDSMKDVCSYVLSVISQSLKFQKFLCNSWMKQLESVRGSHNHRSLDIFVIILLFSVEGYEKKVENVLKNKVKAGDINEDLLHVTFRCHHEVLQNYAPILLKVAETFLHVAEPHVSLFGSSVYMKCFIWFDSFYKQEVIGNLIGHVCNKSESEINAALNTLLSLARNHTQKLVPFALFVRNLLDHLEKLTLNQIRKVHEMLSILAYQGGREGNILLDDMMIIIRKQLTHKSMKYRKMGVIGALMAAKTAAEKDESAQLDLSISSDAYDSEACYQHSIKLLELVAESTSDSLEAFALFCDELSDIMVEKKLGDILLDWIGQNILADFEEKYIIDVSIEDCKKEGVGPKFGLDDVDEPVAIDLYTKVLEEHNCMTNRHVQNGNVSLSKHKKTGKKLNENEIFQALLQFSSVKGPRGEQKHNSSPLKISPVFRLLRIFRHLQDGNLDSIDALLGCAIVLPDLKSLKFSSLSLEEKQNTLHTLFYCVNWIRENLNAFSTSEDEDIKHNLLSRLQLLIVLENLICDCLKTMNDYFPPLANFDCDEQLNSFKLPPKKVSKRSATAKKGKSKKAKADADTEQVEATDTNLENSKALKSDDEEFEPKDGNISNAIMLKKLQPFFRELDLDVFHLFKAGITFQERSDILASNKITTIALHPTELNFLLEDLILKLQYCFSNSVCHLKTAQKKIGFSRLDVHTPIKVSTFCIGLLPALGALAEECTSFFKTILEKADGVEDSLYMRSVIVQHVTQCLILVFKAIKQIVSWKDLNLVENAALLKKALHALAIRSEECRESDPLEKIVALFIDYLCLFANSVPSLECAANLVQLLSSVLCYANNTEAKTRVSDIALMFLKKKWMEIENKSAKNAEINANLKIILETFLRNSISMLKSLDCLCEEALAEIVNAEEENCAFHSLTKSSLICYYKIMFHSLAVYSKEYFSNKEGDNKKKMAQWEVSFKIFRVLTTLIKTFGARYYVGTCLKYSREFLSAFLKHGMPLMDKMFVSNKELVMNLMKSLQSSTRYLQHVCSHSKVLKDVSLIKHVPFLKKNLEAFVFRIKVMLAINKCEEAFWIGNLKNRDLKGVEISSQVAPISSDDEKSENEENNLESDKEELARNRSGSDLSGIGSDSD